MRLMQVSMLLSQPGSGGTLCHAGHRFQPPCMAERLIGLWNLLNKRRLYIQDLEALVPACTVMVSPCCSF